jgi:hypothetical protein
MFPFVAGNLSLIMGQKEEKPTGDCSEGFRDLPERRSIHQAPLRVGQSGIDTACKRANVVAHRTIDTIDHDRDGRQDERVFRDRQICQEFRV